MLETAAVLGNAFAFDLLQRTCDLGQDDLVDALEPAVGAQLVDEPASGDDRHAFSRALIPTCSTDRCRGRAARCCTVARRTRSHRPPPAAHRLRGARAPPRARGRGEDLDRAVVCLSSAAEQAVSLLAYEQAATHLRQAIDLLDRRGATAAPERRCDLVIAQGEAERQAGDSAYRETLLRGAALARQLGDRDRLARAALANNRGFFGASTGVDHERVAVLRHALDALGASDSTTPRACSHTLRSSRPRPRRQRSRISDEALAMARRCTIHPRCCGR